MATGGPPWLGRTDDMAETRRYRAMTPDERLECFVDVCQLAQTILDERPDRAAVLARVDRMAPVIERRWLDLIAKARRVSAAR